MLNQASKKIFGKCFCFKSNFFGRRPQPLLTNTVRYFFFNSGKYDLNKDYYAILGLPQDADPSTIKKEYYKLAKQYHPDVNPNASQKIKLINEAYSVLSDEKLKSEYDQARQTNQVKQKFNQKRQQYQQENEYRAQYHKQYQRAYQQMGEYERYLMKKMFSRFFFRAFFISFSFFLFFALTAPRRVFVDEFGRPIDKNGRPLQNPNNAVVYQSQLPIYDPYNLGGPPQGSYPYQTMYGKQYTAGASPENSQNKGYM